MSTLGMEGPSGSGGGSAGGGGGGGGGGALLPGVTRLAEPARLELGPLTVVLAIIIVLLLSLLTVGCNSIILAAFYRYKRLRTASNCLLVSLAVSDFGVGVFMPFGTYLELMQLGEEGPSLCMLPYCVLIALCSVSVLVTVAIAVDRLTSLAQPLRYKNIITHSSVERYIAVFWLYATVVGLSPLIYAKAFGPHNTHGGSCRFNGVILPPVRVFLFLAVWAPSAFILLGCYMYVYLVARAHARAIYTVELSFRNQTQTLALPRYGQTLAVTVGAFFILWLPFQTCMLLDTFCGTNILSDCTIWLGLPILAHSGTNPWIYAFHHGDIRLAAGKIAEDVVALFGVTPSRYGCSPARRNSNTNLELAEVNSLDERRPPVEDCFAAKQHHSIVYTSRRCLESSSRNVDISPEGANDGSSSGSCGRQAHIVEENIHDLTKMLDPKYIVHRNHVIDSNHNIDKIKNLKYLLDPTFSKIRHLRRLNHKRGGVKNVCRFSDTRFVSYQNLNGGINKKAAVHLNTMSDPMLNADSPDLDTKTFKEVVCHQSYICRKKASKLSSVSDSNIKDTVGTSDTNLKLFPAGRSAVENHRYSEHYLDNRFADRDFVKNVSKSQHVDPHHRRCFTWARARQRFKPQYYDLPSPTMDLQINQTSQSSLPTPDGVYCSSGSSPNQRVPSRQLTITPNKLASFYRAEPSRSMPMEADFDQVERFQGRRNNLEFFQHSETIDTLAGIVSHNRLLEPSRLTDSLTVPTIHSEPPSPIDPLPLDSLQEEDSYRSTSDSAGSPLRSQSIPNHLKSPSRHSDPVLIPSVLLNIEDCSDRPTNVWPNPSPSSISPRELTELLLLRCGDERRFACDTIFPEHDSTRFSSRRPSDSKWSESSRSQEVLSNVTEHPARFPSSYSVNNFHSCNSGSDLNDLTSCLEPFLCSEALSSSLRESFFSAPSVPDSEDIFTSFEADEPTPVDGLSPKSRSCASSTCLVKRPASLQQRLELQSKSTESMFRDKNQSERLCAILRLEPGIHRSRPMVRPVSCKDSRLAPLATPTPTEVCTPTFDITIVADVKNEGGVGVKV